MNDVFLKKVKGFDSSLIPPCFRSLEQKVLRTIFVTSMWQNATLPECSILSAEEYGWEMGDTLKPRWYRGQPTPLLVDDILSLSIDEEDDEFDVESLNFESDED